MAAPMHVFVGSEIGILKGVNAHKKSFKNLTTIQSVDRKKEICVMCWSDSEESKIHIGLKNHLVKTYDSKQELFTDDFACEGQGKFCGIEKYEENLVTCIESGEIRVHSSTGEKKLEINAGANLCCMRQNKSLPNLISTGGKENDLKIWDLQNPTEPIFKARNLPDDWLSLRVPIWVMDSLFLPESEKIVTCTGYHQVRVYDPSTSNRRPVINIDLDEYPLISMCITQNPSQVIVGNTHGTMGLVDLRKGQMVHKFKGFSGSIRCVQCHPTLPYVASCGLDRFLRIHEVNTKKLLRKVYLKSRLNCLLLKSDDWGKIKTESENESSSKQHNQIVEEENDKSDDEDVWDDMEEVKEINSKRKLKSTDEKKSKKTDSSVLQSKSHKKKKEG